MVYFKNMSIAHNFKDISGLRFGKLSVISRSGLDKKRRSLWLCKCDCGKEKIVPGYKLRSTTKSCGCLIIERSKARSSDPEFYKKYPNIARMYLQYKKGAYKRKLSFSITPEEFEKLTLSLCHYCGSIIERNGIDRKDNSVGYDLSNCLPCCWQCNRSKLAMPYEEFIAWIDKLVNKRCALR